MFYSILMIVLVNETLVLSLSEVVNIAIAVILWVILSLNLSNIDVRLD